MQKLLAAADGRVPPRARWLTLFATLAALGFSYDALALPPIAQNDSYAATEDTPLVVPARGVLINDTDVDTPVGSLTAVLVTNVSNGALTLNSNGSFTYTPAANFNGLVTFAYAAHDGTEQSILPALVTITVGSVNDPPTAQNDSYAATEDTPLTVNAASGVLANDTDPEGNSLTAVLNANVTHGTLTLNSNGSFTYTPAANYSGPDSFTYHADDGPANSNVATVSITVAPANDPPTAQNDSYNAVEDGTLTVNAANGVLDNDTDPEGTALTAALASGVAHGTLTLNANGSFTYTPAANYSGPDSFTYRASDGTAQSNVATVTLTVTGANDPPVAQNDSYNATEDTPLVVAAPGVLANDTDPEGNSLTAVRDANVTHGTLTLNSNGSFTYTPAANYSGPDSFTYHADDGPANSNVATVSINVASANDPPVAQNDSYNATEDTPLVVAAPGVLANDTDPEGTALTAALASGVAHGTLTLNANGSFTYTPAANYSGPDSFTYRASDGTVQSNLATVAITVGGANDPPTFTSTPLTSASEGSAYSYTATATDPDGNTLTFSATTLPAWLTFNPATRTLSGTPVQAQVPGPHSVVLSVTDGTAAPVTQSFQITVANVNNAPTFTSTPLTSASEGSAYSYTATATDADGDTLTFSATTLPAWLTFNPATRTLSGTPTQVQVPGPHSVVLSVTDGTAAPVTQSFQINVANTNDAPTFTSTPITSATQGAPYSYAIVATDVDGDTLTISATTRPAWLALTPGANGAATLAGTPGQAQVPGPHSVVLSVTDGTVAATQSFQISVANVNDPPFVTSAAPTSVNEHATYTYTITATDPDGDTLTFAAVTLPAWLTLTPGTNGRATLASMTGRPNQGDVGTHLVALTVSDGIAAPVPHNFQIVVNAVDDPPVVAPIPDQTATEAVSFSLNLATFVTDEDTPAANLVYTTTSPLPAGLSLAANGVLSGIPVLALSPGDYTITFNVRDNPTRQIPASFHLTVLRAGRADLAVTVAATPNPVAINTSATWTIAITNNAPQVNVGAIALEATFSGAPFQFDPAPAGCAVAVSGADTRATCSLGPLAGGASMSVSLTGRGNTQGDVLATAKVSISGMTPIDETERNDTATGVLSIAQSVSAGPGQQIGGMNVRAAAAGDTNGDGFTDLAFVTQQSTGIWLNVVDPNNAKKRILSPTPFMLGGQDPANHVALVDLDGDSDLDVVTAAGQGGSKAYLNAGANGFTGVIVTDPSEDSRAVAVGDVNGDALTDLVFANGSPNTIYLSQGAPGLYRRGGALGNADSRGVALVDLFGDALPDLVFANADGHADVYRNTGGAFVLELALPTGPTTSVAAADLNNDGRADLVFGRDLLTTSDPPGDLVYFNTSVTAGSFALVTRLGTAPTTAVSISDIDLDGDPDILTVNGSGAHQLYANTGAANAPFVLHAQQLGSAGAVGAAIGKLSVDDRIDVAIVGQGGAAIFYNDGKGNLGPGDVGAPTIQLRGDSTVTLTVEGAYADAGATATDTTDGDLTAQIVVDNPVNAAVIGTYTVTYNVADRSGNSATPVLRTVRVQARQASGGGGGGASGAEFAVLLALAMIGVRLRRGARVAQGIRFAGAGVGVSLALAIAAGSAKASELGYTLLDFQRVDSTIDVPGAQTPVPGQSVDINVSDGEGIGVGGSLAIRERFYVGGFYQSSVIDFSGVIRSPLITLNVRDTFDLVSSSLGFGYFHEIAENLDLVAEVSYESSNYDFGSLAGENFDIDDSGPGARVGFRWNPIPAFELHAYGHYSPVATPLLSERRFDSGSSFGAGIRWYLFENLAFGLEHESADVEKTVFSMRFGFGNLQM